MASGYGYTGGRPRCFAYWQDFSKCYANTDDPKNCILPLGDYVECLHRPKEIARAKAVEQEFLRRAQAVAKEGRKASDVLADGAIVGLGIIQQSQEGQKENEGKRP